MADVAERKEGPKLTKKDFASDQLVRWCPGCGDYSILSAMTGALPQLDIPKENIVFDIKKDEGIEIPGVVYCGGLKKFPMHENWQPDTNEFITACFRYGIKKEEITQDVILNFVDYWSERTDIKTESGWCKKLVSDFKMYKGRVQSHERSKKPVSRNTNRSKYHDIHEILENSEDE